MSRKTKRNLDVKVKEKIERPKRYKVIMLNDDYTPMEFVTEVLRTVFHKNHEQAYYIMRTVHEQGIGVAGIYSKDIAETKKDKAILIARERQYPLMLRTEPE